MMCALVSGVLAALAAGLAPDALLVPKCTETRLVLVPQSSTPAPKEAHFHGLCDC